MRENQQARLYKACGNEETATCEAAMAARTLELQQELKQDGLKQDEPKQQAAKQEGMKVEAAKKGTPRETIKTVRLISMRKFIHRILIFNLL